MKLVLTDHFVAVAVTPPTAANADDMEAAALGSLRSGATQIADPDDQYGLPFDMIGKQGCPFRPRLCVHQCRDTIVEHQETHQDVFAGFLVVDATIIGELNAFRHPVEWTESLMPAPIK